LNCHGAILIKNRASDLQKALGDAQAREKGGFARFESLMQGLRNYRNAGVVRGLPDFSAHGARILGI
jgi:hypothetical protein